VAEAVLEAARLEHEERKVVYFGRLLGNIACRPDISRAEANALIRTARGLSYRQLAMLAMFSTRSPDSLPAARIDDSVPPPVAITLEKSLLAHELVALDSIGLVRFPNLYNGGKGITPAKATLQTPGRTLSELMNLQSIPSNDIETVIESLR
jgi:hypothetical protein